MDEYLNLVSMLTGLNRKLDSDMFSPMLKMRLEQWYPDIIWEMNDSNDESGSENEQEEDAWEKENMLMERRQELRLYIKQYAQPYYS